ncbi:DNA polymerase IV [Thermobispora bispora]|jgi:DNA polymerase IV|uniref:DNA polymerase IV n=1 Tax=Thermobispora bispora (strain ATCC 19993 / DSM 43833 / CBS 139.67 / JCM 10125 / KCTC 9307 / NBRC 14880 / R51) TaxID=469371 RepID=D6Y9J1_THEBD|nr:DNA polymerase IV [Thermobispora bispora]MBO2474011.1 DNA polymerase IV [Actinomycetales bacterium]MDI9580334.1 DNA polymerase IV [Thermobispora sp.]ADG88111.1 DNA-directed DNA polymerase [Thermobispora bispora DSM 43833]MBX6169397.1 DNA polymerase IV [Thermobispora bispora]QSI47968.1 DNA polymerase IV [Thermobispora bispora]
MSRQPIRGSVPDGPAGDTGCPILHVDMDAFYASVELLDRPELRGAPVIVGSPGPRGVVLSASYEARRYGVRSAMPMTQARRRCPAAVIIPPRHAKYAEVSRGIMELLRDITPLVEPIALDEAFLDVGGARRRLGPPAAIARMIREQVAGRFGITCSVGVANSKFVAKLASRRCKPDGMLVVPADKVIEFLHPLPVAELWGVGERTEQALTRLGIRTVGDLARVPVATLRREFGALGERLAELAWGRDDRPVVPDAPDKSIGSEETFSHDVDDPETIKRELLRLSERVAARLRAGGYVGRTVSVKLRRSDFTTITRSRTLREPTDVAREIYGTARGLYESSGLERARLRLVGVRVENLRPAATAAHQLSLGEREKGWRDVERAMDRVIMRFGPGAVRPASLVEPPHDEMGL